MRTANPALNANTFSSMSAPIQTTERMTIEGTVNKTAFLGVVLCLTAAFTWGQYVETQTIGAWHWIGLIGGLVTAIVLVFKKTAAPILAPVYAAFEGLFLGGLSAMAETYYPGIVMQAIGLTFGVLFALLAAYRSGMIQATENFKLGVFAATGGIFLLYMVSWVMSLFGYGIPFIHEGGLLGIGFSVFVCVIAALNLVLDFDFIENGSEHGAPKYMEWYAAFGLTVTLVWLYIEILRLLMKLQSRD